MAAVTIVKESGSLLAAPVTCRLVICTVLAEVVTVLKGSFRTRAGADSLRARPNFSPLRLTSVRWFLAKKNPTKVGTLNTAY